VIAAEIISFGCRLLKLQLKVPQVAAFLSYDVRFDIDAVVIVEYVIMDMPHQCTIHQKL